MLQIHQFPCLSDNYGFLLHDPASFETVCIDTPDAEAYLREANARGWPITAIWNTHWHPDHAGGNAAIKARTGCEVIAPVVDAPKIAEVDRTVNPGDVVRIGAWEATVIDVGGHTMGHIAYHLPEAGLAFVGDLAVRARLRADVRGHAAAVLGEPRAPQGAAARRPRCTARTSIPSRTPASRSTLTRTTPHYRPTPRKSAASARRASRRYLSLCRASSPPIRSCAPTTPRCKRAGAAPRRPRPSRRYGRLRTRSDRPRYPRRAAISLRSTAISGPLR